jgi:hypothetical protein
MSVAATTLLRPLKDCSPQVRLAAAHALLKFGQFQVIERHDPIFKGYPTTNFTEGEADTPPDGVTR